MTKNSVGNSLVSSASRPLGLRVRSDITMQRQSYQGRDYWVVKDPIALKYYRFEAEEYALLKMLDGSSTPEQIKRRFDYQFAPQKIELQELFQFIGMLYRSCLLVSDAAGQGDELKRRGVEKSQQQFKGALSNVLAIRFRGFDPDGLLNVLDNYFGWLFSKTFFCLVLVFWFSALALLFTQFDLFTRRLPSFHEFFAAKNWFWLAIVMATTKIIHELGHGLACKRFGGQCHEMGVMLLVMTPCLYCNVSDSWTLPSKWKRALIAAAGLYVELIMAAAAVFIWWFSHPGLINQLALNIVFVSSVSALLINGNPLLRYDGYYILSDVLEIPNLRQKATTLLQRQLASWAMGIKSKPDPFLPSRRKWFFACYSIAAAVYRWLITFTIFSFLYSLLEPYGVKIIGQMIAFVAIWGLIGMPLIQVYRFFAVPGRFGSVNRGRTVVSLGLFCAAIAGVLLIPIPHYVRCPLTIQPQNIDNVYVDVPGVLKEVYVSSSGYVRQGQPLIRLVNPELEIRQSQLSSNIKNAKSELDALRRAADTDIRNNDVGDELQIARSELLSATNDFELLQQDAQRLTVSAPRNGFLLPPHRTEKQPPSDGALPTWSGYPLEKKNVGSYLQQSTVVARVVPDLSQMQAVLIVDQSEIEFIKVGQAVRLLPTAIPGAAIEAKIATISRTKLDGVPKALSSRFGGEIITTQDRDGRFVPQSTAFQVSVPFECTPEMLADGCTGNAKIHTGYQTIGQRLWRLAQQTFRFEL